MPIEPAVTLRKVMMAIIHCARCRDGRDDCVPLRFHRAAAAENQEVKKMKWVHNQFKPSVKMVAHGEVEKG